MRAKIGQLLLAKIQPKDKPFEIYDTELKGFTLRIQPSGSMSYVVRYRLRDGKQTRLVIGKTGVYSPMQARDEARELLLAVSKGGDPIASKRLARAYSLKGFIEGDYGQWLKAHQKDGQTTIDRLENCFKEFYGRRLNEITPWIVEKWKTTRSKAGIKPSTVNRDIANLKSLLSKAVEWGLLLTHPLSTLKPAKVDHNRIVRYLSDDEEARLRAAAQSREDKLRIDRTSANEWRRQRGYTDLLDLDTLHFADHLMPMILVSINTGLRRGELFHL